MGWEDTYLEARHLSKQGEKFYEQSEIVRRQGDECHRRATELYAKAKKEQNDHLDRLEERKAKGY